MAQPPYTPSDRPGADLASRQLIGSDFGARYRIESELGQGGVGVVFRATDKKLDQRVALKLLRRDVAGSPQRRRFEREAKALAALRHPNIVSILDCGVSDSTPYLVMELLEGGSLADALRKDGAFALERAERVMRELLAALAYVHASGLVHRDLKPGNVFLQRLPKGGEQVKLLDFGLAKFVEGELGSDTTTLTRSGEVFGTPAYMPPEQWSGQPVDARADVYSATVVAFELLAGRKLFQGDAQELLRSQLVENAPALHEASKTRVARPELERLLQRGLAKVARDRYRDANELAAAFAALPKPWLYEGKERTAERERAALRARDVVRMGVAATMEQPTFEEDAAAGGTGSARTSPRPPRRGAFALLRGVVLASAWTLSAFSLLAIGVAVALIFVLRGPGRVEQRAALERALPEPLRDAVTRSAEAAKTAVQGAVVDAKEQVSAALQPADAGTAVLVAPPDPDLDEKDPPPAPLPRSLTGPRVPARNPWRASVPRALRKPRAIIHAGKTGNDRLVADLRRYNRANPRDARGHLLLAHLFVNRNVYGEVVVQYLWALARDPSSRGDPHVLRDLLRAISRDADSDRAIELIAASYGRDALAASTAARNRARTAEERARFDRLVRALTR